VINTETGKIEKTIPVEGAAGLNDVSVDSKGVIYTSDSRGKKVFRVENGNAQLYLDNLSGPNGILMRGNDFYVLDNGGMYKMGADKSLTKITDGMQGGTDGIENVQGDDFIVSCWGGVLWYVNADGTKEMLKDTRREQKGNTADIGYDPVSKTVYVPTFWRNSVIAYQISEE
jgi:hypothetical protein